MERSDGIDPAFDDEVRIHLPLVDELIVDIFHSGLQLSVLDGLRRGI